MNENIDRRNMWSTNFIVDFERMIQQHHTSLNSFQHVGSMLETSAKIYGWRVDSLYTDVVRLSTCIRTHQNVMDMDSSSASHNSLASSVRSIRDTSIRRRRSAYTTVVGNKDLIDAPLQTIEVPSRSLYCMYGRDINSVKNLFQSVLPSDHYTLTLQPKHKFLTDQNVANGSDQFDEFNEANVDLPVSVHWFPSIRPRLNAYQMSNLPCEHFRYPETSTAARLNQPNSEDTVVISHADEPSMELNFDLDADPIPQNGSEPMMPSIGVSFTEDDRNAVTDDLRPLTSTPLSYSYRRLTDIPLPTDAGHWKLPSIIQATGAGGKSTKRKRRRKIAKDEPDEPVRLKNVLSERVEQKFLSVNDPRTRAIRKLDHTKWQSNKLTMLSRMNLSSAVKFLPLMINYMENEESDHSDESNIEIDSTSDVDTGNGINSHRHDDGMELDMDQLDVILPLAENAIDENCVIVPPMSQIPFYITPANVDVKANTTRCLEIICALEANGGEATFGQIYAQLQADGQAISPALIFSSILELANRNNFRLEKIGHSNDFVIKRV